MTGLDAVAVVDHVVARWGPAVVAVVVVWTVLLACIVFALVAIWHLLDLGRS